jgi:hypothetical protein
MILSVRPATEAQKRDIKEAQSALLVLSTRLARIRQSMAPGSRMHDAAEYMAPLLTQLAKELELIAKSPTFRLNGALLDPALFSHATAGRKGGE